MSNVTAPQMAAAFVDALLEAGYPYLAPQTLLEVGNAAAFPLVEVWDDDAQVIRVVVFCDQDHQLGRALLYAQYVIAESGHVAVLAVMWPQGFVSE